MQFKTTKAFWKSFHALGDEEKKAAKEAFQIFKADPMDARLRPHKINRLSSRFRKTVRSVTILGDLRAVFVVDGDKIITFDIGAHDIYR